MRITVCSLTPSRIGIITSRRTWSKPLFVGSNLAGISLGSAEFVAFDLVLDWAIAACVRITIAKTVPVTDKIEFLLPANKRFIGATAGPPDVGTAIESADSLRPGRATFINGQRSEGCSRRQDRLLV